MAEPIIDLTEEGFDAEISAGVWLVDFWADWCGPCHALEPVLTQLAAEYEGARIGRVEVSEQEALGERFSITSLPTLVVFRDGEPVNRMFGTKNNRQLVRALDEAAQATSP